MADVYHTGHHTDLDLLSTTVNVVAHDDYCSNAKMKIDIKAKPQFFLLQAMPAGFTVMTVLSNQPQNSWYITKQSNFVAQIYFCLL